MKNSNWLRRTAAYVRVTAAVTVLAAGCALALVATRTETATKQVSKADVRLRGDADRIDGDSSNPQEGGPLAYAMQDWAHRIYPAEEIPFETPLRSAEAWNKMEARRPAITALNPQNPFLFWRLAGPSIAPQPAVLSFTGAPYTTSGRVTGLALNPANCTPAACRLWVATAGGGVWRTDNALAQPPNWTFVSQSFATNAIGTLVYDAPNNTLYAGTGEPNVSADSEAGLGVYKSTDGGNNWTLLASQIGPITTTSPGTGANGTYTGNAFLGRAISSITVDPTNPNHLFVASLRAVRGVAPTGGSTSNPPTPRPPFGLFESTDGGATFKFIWDGGDACPTTCDGTNTKASIRGTNDVKLDPGWNGTSNKIVYANTMPSGVAGSGGIWRSNDGGSTWTQIHTARNAADNSDRASFAVTPLAGGKTRIYAGIGNGTHSAANFAHVFRTDDAVAATGDASWTDLTALQDASTAPNQTTNYCSTAAAGAQCWYDNVIYTPPGRPDVIYVGGSYDYDQYGFRNDARAFLRSTDAGVTFTDMTWDANITNPAPNPTCCQNLPFAQNGMHPDSHAVIEVPGSDIAIYGSDGGVVRTNGTFTDISSTCTDPSRNGGLSGANLNTCKQLLKAVPTQLINMNTALSTLQFQTVSVSAQDNTVVQGGTQDNGTLTSAGTQAWPQEYFGDGGLSGFSSTNQALRFGGTTGRSTVANFRNGDPTKWVLIYNGIETAVLFYGPKIADPSTGAPQTIFVGGTSVWRTQDWGGPQAALEANCNFLTAVTLAGCGDFQAIGPAGNTQLTASNADYRGTTRSGGNVSWIARTPQDTSTAWVATSTGRVFVSKNVDNPVPALVTWTRVDTLSAASPNRFVTGIFIDPNNANHAWISYNGYNFNTPTTPGHIFSVVFNPAAVTATFTPIDGTGAGAFPDFPATAVASAPNGDLYVANDFGVLRRPQGVTDWEVAGFNMPMVEVSGLTISPDGKKLYAATHGRSAFVADLPSATRVSPVLTTTANPASGNLGSAIHDSATLSGGLSPTGSITFQLYGPNDATCSGASAFTSTVAVNDNGTYDSASFTPTQPGTYRWVATYTGDTNNNPITTACNDPNETVTIGATAQFLNMSTRMRTDATTNNGNSVGIGGFTITGSVAKHVIVRAIGPSLTKFGIASTDVLPDPVLEVHGPGAFGTITNNNWRDSQEAQIKLDGLAPTNDLESAIDATLPPGAYTAIIKGNTGTAQAGVCMFEVYDLDSAATSKLANLSTRAFVGTGNNVVIAGFVLGRNQGNDRVVVRGLGPSLSSFGIGSTLADPTLELRDENGTLILANNDWQDNAAQAAQVTAAGLAPLNTKESAIAASLAPGAYTAILSGLNNTTGVGTVEVYDLGP